MMSRHIKHILLTGLLSACNLSHGADLVIRPTDPRYITQHQIGCKNTDVLPGDTDVYHRFRDVFHGAGTWSVIPSGGCSGVAGAATPDRYLTFGPATTEVESGANTAVFTLMTGTSNSSTNGLAVLDVYCNSTGATLASRTIDHADFRNAYAPEDFGVTFNHNPTQCARLEFRVFWKGGAELHHVKTIVGRTKQHIVYPGDAPYVSFPGTVNGNTAPTVQWHHLGCQAANGTAWTHQTGAAASPLCVTSSPTRFMTYGPYTSNLGSGNYWAKFSLARPSGVYPTGRVEVYAVKSGRTLGTAQFSAAQFPTQNAEVAFTVPFTYDANADHRLEYRVWLDSGDLTHLKTVISPRADTDTACVTDSMCRVAPVGCVFNYPYTSSAITSYPLIARRDHSPVASSWGPYGAEGAPTGSSCVNDKPFCVANACSATPASAAGSVVIDSAHYLDFANNTNDNPWVVHRVDSAGKRTVVFNPTPNSTEWPSLRSTPNGLWAGSYDLPLSGGQSYYFKIKLAADTNWSPSPYKTEGTLAWFQPGQNDGRYYNIQFKKTASPTNIEISVATCRFQHNGDFCTDVNGNNTLYNPTRWTIPNTTASKLPTTFYLKVSQGNLTLLNSAGAPITVTNAAGQTVPFSYSDSRMVLPLSNIDVTFFNANAITLEDMKISRQFIQ